MTETSSEQRVTDKVAESWRLSIAAATVPLGAFNWPWALGLALDDRDALRAERDELRAAAHKVAEKIDEFLTKEHAPPIWMRCSDIAHTAAGCTWDDDAGDDGEYDCETRARTGEQR